MRHVAKMTIKQKAKWNVLLALRLHTKCLISHEALARQCFDYFEELALRCICCFN